MAKSGNEGNGGVEIPISVVGAEQAQQQLRATAQAAQQTAQQANEAGGGTPGKAEHSIEEASDKAARAKKRLGDETHKAGEELFDFDRKGEKLVKGALSAISPELGQAADAAIDLAEGFTKISPSLLGVAGIGVAIGLATVAVQTMSAALKDAQEKAERFAEAQRAIRDEAVKGQGTFADDLLKIGVNPASGAQAANETFMRLANGGNGQLPMPQSFAREVGKARAFAAANGIPFDEQQFAAGLAVSRGEGPSATTPDEYAAAMKNMLAAGGEPGAAGLLNDYLSARLPATLRENIGLPTTTPGDSRVMEDQVIAEKVRRGDITDERAKRATALLNDPQAMEKAKAAEKARSDNTIWPLDKVYYGEWTGETGNEQRIALQVAEQAQREAAARLGGRSNVGAPIPGDVRPFTVNVYNTTNVAQQHNGTRGPIGKDTYEDAGN